MATEPRHLRRSAARLASVGRVRIEVVSVRFKVRLRDLGLGGFSVVADTPFAPQATSRFRFTTSPTLSFVLTARNVYCGRLDGSDRFVAGFAFLADGLDKLGELDRVVSTLIDAAKSDDAVH
jgi:PilZ domain